MINLISIPKSKTISNPNVIDMQPGEYLMDIFEKINALPDDKKPNSVNPFTVNFYNHSKTIDWDRWTDLVKIPSYVTINFIGKPKHGFMAGFSFLETDVNFTPLLISPDFLSVFIVSIASYLGIVEIEDASELTNGTREDMFLFLRNTSNMDNNYSLWRKVGEEYKLCLTKLHRVFITNKSYFGCEFNFCAFDENTDLKNIIFNSTTFIKTKLPYLAYNNIIQNCSFNDSKINSISFSELKDTRFINTEIIGFYNCTLKKINFYNCPLQGIVIKETKLEGLSFFNSDLTYADFNDVESIKNTCFYSCNLINVMLPERINTKQKFIAECGVDNVNAETKWIDGTSILS